MNLGPFRRSAPLSRGADISRYQLISRHLAWHRQFVPHDVHDYDVSHVAPAFKTTISGSIRNVVASTGKDGLLRLCHPLRLALFCEYTLGSVPTVMV
jgi:hypothetical protein